MPPKVRGNGPPEATASKNDSLYFVPWKAKPIALGKSQARLWVLGQLIVGSLVMPIFTTLAMQLLADWQWIGHGDNYADFDQLSLGTFVFIAVGAIGPLVASCIPLASRLGKRTRILTRCLCFVVYCLMFWPVILFYVLVAMLCFGSGFALPKLCCR